MTADATVSPRSYGGRSVADRKAERRARFLDAGLTVFAERTYANSTISDVCAAAGLSRRQFYEEFRDREHLLTALYDSIFADNRTAIAQALTAAPSGDIRRIADVAMRALVESVGTDPRRAQVAFVEVVGVSAAMEAHRAQSREEWVRFFEALVRTYFPDAIEPPGGWRLAGTAFVGAVTYIVHQWAVESPRGPVEPLVGILVTILVALAQS